MATVRLNTISDALAALRNVDLAQALYDEGKVIMDGTLLTLHGEEHRARRVLEFRVFRRSFFRYYETEVFPRALAELLGPTVARGRCDLVDFGFRITMNLTADFAGVDRPERSPQETEALVALVKTFSEGATLVHSRRDKEAVRKEVRVALEEFSHRFLAPSVKRRQELLARFASGAIAETELPRDVLTVLLQNEDRLELPPDLLCREIAFYLQAGSHSTANSTTHAMHDILEWGREHPQDRRRMDVDPVFVQRCVHESLRLHPASPVSWRKPICPMQLSTGASVSPQDRVEIDLWTANREKETFGPDADVYNPHRAVAGGREPFGVTFGTGVHTCLGRDLDAGIVPKANVDPAEHQYGIITMLARALLDAGAEPDPTDPPVFAEHTERPNWGRYPVVFA